MKLAENAAYNVTYRFLTCADVLVEQFWPFDADEVEPALLCYSRREECLSATGIPIQ